MRMKSKQSCYRIEVKCTNGARNTVMINDPLAGYAPCEDGALYVVTDDPRQIHDWLGDRLVAMTKLGVGYYPIEDLGAKSILNENANG
jgi:hypothetical protein